MRKFFIAILMALIASSSDGSTLEVNESGGVDPAWCTREVLMSFFPQPIVQSVLIKHELPQIQAKEISQTLASKDAEILQTIEKKSSKLEPQNLIDVNQREAALQLFKETLFDTFSKVFQSYHVNKSSEEIRKMMDEIQETKGILFIKCIQEKSKK